MCLKSFLPKINEKMVENSKAVGQGGESIFLLNFSYIFYSIALYFMPIDVTFKSTSIDIQGTGKLEDLTLKILEIPIQSHVENGAKFKRRPFCLF